jgi:hypothetical protein
MIAVTPRGLHFFGLSPKETSHRRSDDDLPCGWLSVIQFFLQDVRQRSESSLLVQYNKPPLPKRMHHVVRRPRTGVTLVTEQDKSVRQDTKVKDGRCTSLVQTAVFDLAFCLGFSSALPWAPLALVMESFQWERMPHLFHTGHSAPSPTTGNISSVNDYQPGRSNSR